MHQTSDNIDATIYRVMAAESSAYQTYLEGHRLDPDNEELYADLRKAWAVLQIAWLYHRMK